MESDKQRKDSKGSDSGKFMSGFSTSRSDEDMFISTRSVPSLLGDGRGTEQAMSEDFRTPREGLPTDLAEMMSQVCFRR